MQIKKNKVKADRDSLQVLTRLCGKINVQEFDEIVDLDVLLAMEM